MFENCNVEITSKNDEKNDEKERRILKSDNLLDSEYATHFWMRASGSEHMKRIFPPMNVDRVLNASTIYL